MFQRMRQRSRLLGLVAALLVGGLSAQAFALSKHALWHSARQALAAAVMISVATDAKPALSADESGCELCGIYRAPRLVEISTLTLQAPQVLAQGLSPVAPSQPDAPSSRRAAARAPPAFSFV